MLRKASRKYALQRLAIGLFYLIMVNVIGANWPASALSDGSLHNMSFVDAAIYMFVVAQLSLRRYISIWLISEGASIISGMSLVVSFSN